MKGNIQWVFKCQIVAQTQISVSEDRSAEFRYAPTDELGNKMIAIRVRMVFLLLCMNDEGNWITNGRDPAVAGVIGVSDWTGVSAKYFTEYFMVYPFYAVPHGKETNPPLAGFSFKAVAGLDYSSAYDVTLLDSIRLSLP